MEGVSEMFSLKNNDNEDSSNKKILLLDLDETLVHADFDEE